MKVSHASLSRGLLAAVGLLSGGAAFALGGTEGLWLFDEPSGSYPSSVLNDAGPNSLFLILGRGAAIDQGRFGQALHVVEPSPLDARFDPEDKQAVLFGLKSAEKQSGRSLAPMTWQTANFAAFFTSGERHLRHDDFANATATALNLGAFPWTVEGWLKLDRASRDEAAIFEIGRGPRGENDDFTRIAINAAQDGFVFQNGAGNRIDLPMQSGPLPLGTWFHFAVVHEGAEKVQLFVNGRRAAIGGLPLRALPFGEEAYVSIGRDGRWGRPLPGALDELRVSDEAVYRRAFTPPDSFSLLHSEERPPQVPATGPPLLFVGTAAAAKVVELGSRRHLFIDDALLDRQENLRWQAHPARMAEQVLTNVSGWISVAESDDGIIYLYTNGPEDSLALYTSRDGVNFEAPDLGKGEFHGRRNIVVTDPATVGTVFRDPNGLPGGEWKLVTGLRKRGGVFVYTSSDGLAWRRHEAASLPFWTGSAVNVFYDDQRQRYVIHNRTDFFRTPGGATYRKSVLTEVTDLLSPWPFEPLRQDDPRLADVVGPTMADELYPIWLDNGPLAPGGFAVEYPVAFEADPRIDPEGTDVYNTRAQKYPWAEDAYVAFPLFFFHYYGDGPITRQFLAQPSEDRGSGVVETQLATSRDGLAWQRYPRPAYVGIGEKDGYPVRRSYVGYGMVRRGRELWQYTYTRSTYHDSWSKSPAPDVIHRLVQRVDGFVSLDAPYAGGSFTTRPLRFSGNRLVLNVDTDATGFLQIGFVNEAGEPISGFALDDCVYVNGDEIDYEVEWLQGRDVSALADKVVRLVGRMRGTQLYALQFANRPN